MPEAKVTSALGSLFIGCLVCFLWKYRDTNLIDMWHGVYKINVGGKSAIIGLCLTKL